MIGMTIDEAIQRENKIAEENQKIVDTGIVFDDVSVSELYCDDAEAIEEHLSNYRKCAEYHGQLAEWLEELKKRRSEDYGYMADIHQSIVYRQALDDIKEELMKNGFIYTQHALDVFDRIVKKLKEGN